MSIYSDLYSNKKVCLSIFLITVDSFCFSKNPHWNKVKKNDGTSAKPNMFENISVSIVFQEVLKM